MKILAPSLALVALLPCACMEATTSSAASPTLTSAICVLRGTDGNEQVGGKITFRQDRGMVRIEGTFSGLTPGQHGFHIHQWGDIDCGDGTCTGGHFNPAGVDHGGPDASVRHAGDLGNLEADGQGNATYSREDASVQLGGANSIIGRAIIVHAAPDNFTTQPTGDAGARVAYGVIGIGKE